MVYVIFSLFIIYVVYNEWTRYKDKKEFTRIRIENENRFNEFENYAYTDIRELLDFLDEVKNNDKK